MERAHASSPDLNDRQGRAGGGRPSTLGNHAAIAFLQRAAGNRAVAALLAPALPAVQRSTCGQGSCGCASCAGPDDETLQRAVAQRAVVQPPVVQRDDDEPPEAEPLDAPAKKPATPSPVACPTVSWSDYPVGAGSDGFAATTAYTYGGSPKALTVTFDASASWRLASVTATHSDALTDCKKNDFAKNGFATVGDADAACPANIVPAAATAKELKECDSNIKPAVDTANAAESARLLRHEQYHLNLACALATKANAAGVSQAVLEAKDRKVVADYDSSTTGTDNGCKQDKQNAWEKEIDKGLPKVSFGK